MMLVETDTEVGATYYRFSDEPVARTLDLTDLIMVDLDQFGRLVGIDFSFDPAEASESEWDALFDWFPETKAFLPVGSPRFRA